MKNLKRKEVLSLIFCLLCLGAAVAALIAASRVRVQPEELHTQSNITSSFLSSQAEEANAQLSTAGKATFAIVSLYGGKVAAFYPGDTEPFLILAVSSADLPEADRLLLQKGIEASSRAELLHILEDFES